MKTPKIILIIVLIALITPAFSIFVLSIQSQGGYSLRNYGDIVKDDRFIAALRYSTFTSLVVAIFTVLISFILALSWYSNRQKLWILLFVIILGLMPSDIIALSISRSFQYVGMYGSTKGGLILGLLLFTIPFGILIFWSRFYYIERNLITAAKDIGMKNLSIIHRIIWPLAFNATVSCFVLSYLLSFNEYARTYYLSGSDEFLSEYLNGKLSSGANQSIYAGGSLTVLVTVVAILIIALFNYRTVIKARRFNIKG